MNSKIVCAQDLPDYKYSSRTFPDILVLSLCCDAEDTGCMFLIPVTGRGVFTRARNLKLNDIEGCIGPAPNERLGMVDVMFTASMQSATNSEYTGLHLFSEMLQEHEIESYCKAMEGFEYHGKVVLNRLQFARFTVYDTQIDTELFELIRNVLFDGCIVSINGATGLIVGTGARHTKNTASLSLSADLFPMKKEHLILDSSGFIKGHNITLGIPLSSFDNPNAVLKRAAYVASSFDANIKHILASSEKNMMGVLGG
jgi:uncharacterized protein (DUF39 family)